MINSSGGSHADVPHQNRYRELLEAHRTFAHITSIKREGRALKELVYGALAVLCPACPQPDENMDPNWRARPQEEKYVLTAVTTREGG